MRTPSSALPIEETPSNRSLLFFGCCALWIQSADAAALAAGRRVDDGIDEGRPARVHGLVHRTAQLVRCRRLNTDAAERFHHLVVTRVLDEDRWRNVGTAGGIDVGSSIDAVVVEDNDADWQVVPANRFHFHAGEPKGAVAFYRQYRFARFDGGRHGEAHADAHDAPRANVEALARLIHVDRAARQ